jgi:hypothetical protein
MRIIILIFIFALSINFVCFASSDQSESITITTYYPSPYGEYKTLRLYPSDEPVGSAVQPGVMYFNQSDNTTYIYNGSEWGRMGSSGGSSVSATKVDSGDKVYPDTCDGVTRHPVGLTPRSVPGDTTPYVTCSVVWHKNLTFNKAFNKPPRVFVQTHLGSGRPGHEWENYTCARHSTDLNRAFVMNITTTGFQLWSSGSPPFSYDCGDDIFVTESFVKAEASWLAIGE